MTDITERLLFPSHAIKEFVDDESTDLDIKFYSVVNNDKCSFTVMTDIPEEKLEWCRRVEEEYKEVQKYLSGLFDEVLDNVLKGGY